MSKVNTQTEDVSKHIPSGRVVGVRVRESENG